MKSKICAYTMLLLALAQIVLVLLSWLITAAMPEAFPRSMLSPEGIRWFFGSFTENMESPWLVGLLLLDEFPISYFAIRRADNLGFRNVVLEDSFRALQFQRHVFYYDYFKVFHYFILYL